MLELPYQLLKTVSHATLQMTFCLSPSSFFDMTPLFYKKSAILLPFGGGQKQQWEKIHRKRTGNGNNYSVTIFSSEESTIAWRRPFLLLLRFFLSEDCGDIYLLDMLRWMGCYNIMIWRCAPAPAEKLPLVAFWMKDRVVMFPKGHRVNFTRFVY